MSWMENKANQFAKTGQAWTEEESKRMTKVFSEMKGAAKSGVAGQMAGVFAGLGPMSIALSLLSNILKPFEPLLNLIGQLFQVLGQGIFLELFKVIKPFLPLLSSLIPIFQLIGTVIGWMIRVGLFPLVAAIYGIGLVIAAMIDLFTFGAAGAIRGWNNLMLPIMGAMLAPPEFHSGTRGVPSTGVYTLEKGEHVISKEDRLSELRREWHLERQTAALERLVTIKEGRMY